jgi:hypothetical protein
MIPNQNEEGRPMTNLKIAGLALLATTIPAIGYAADLGGLLKTQPVFAETTDKKLYDLERCMIEVDAPIMPIVYRQPDRPQRAMLVWDGGDGIGGVSAAAQLDGLENTKVTFWGREKILRRIKPCLETVYAN